MSMLARPGGASGWRPLLHRHRNCKTNGLPVRAMAVESTTLAYRRGIG
jgi:hypothetical protein